MKIIQICGTNGTGKTTLMKNLLRSGKFLKMSVAVGGKSREWWFDGRIAIIGKYGERNCGGVDADGYNTNALLQTIEHLIRDYHPSAILLENVTFSKLYTFNKKVQELSEKSGYEYIAFVLVASLAEISSRIIARTGNESVDFDRIRSMARTSINTAKKLAENGGEVLFIDTVAKGPKAVLSELMRILYE